MPEMRLRPRRAYANELLPEILGGPWMISECATWPLFYHHSPYGSEMSDIYDHETVFRLRGMHGPNGWFASARNKNPDTLRAGVWIER